MASRPAVLAVDHDPAVLAALRRHLGAAGYDVSVAANALIAGCRLLQRPPHLLIIAADTPEVGGLDFVSALVADCAMPNIPVVFLVRSTGMSPRVEALGAGCLALPFGPRRLLRMVERLAGPGVPAPAPTLVRPAFARPATRLA